jgi:glutamyl-tRNA synthetase
MRITQVLRGADLLSSTARQILLYRMLGLREPRWAHAPLVVGPTGERLSKRDRSISLRELKAGGADPRRLIARLASLSGLDAPPHGCLPRDLVATFALARVPRGPARIAEADG